MDLHDNVEDQVLALLVKEGMFVCVAYLSHC